MSRKEELIKDLKGLMDKHDVFICFSCSDCSDTYGLHDERIEILSNKDPETSILRVDGWCICRSDL